MAALPGSRVQSVPIALTSHTFMLTHNCNNITSH
jgi:hypothetical protein